MSGHLIPSDVFTDSQDETGQQPEPLLLSNLLTKFVELVSLLRCQLRSHALLDSYLLAAGLNQIVEDYLHPDPFLLTRVSKHVAKLHMPIGAIAAVVANGFAVVLSHPPGFEWRRRHLVRWQIQIAAFVQDLADAVMSPESVALHHSQLLKKSDAVLAGTKGFPLSLQRALIRLPACFRSFDQRPADVDRLVEEFAQRWPDRGRPLIVVGVRTSGSYLAPLYAAALKVRGYDHVLALTLRPGRALLSTERSKLRGMTVHHGFALLVDDPPNSGGSVAAAAEQLKQAGVPHDGIVLLLQLFASHVVLPAPLRKYASVLLPWPEWSVHEKLRPESVGQVLGELLGPHASVVSVQRVPLKTGEGARGHARAVFQVQVMDRETQRLDERWIYVKGAGLGYFGRHALAVAHGLGPLVPEVFGVRDGLVYRAWLPETQRLTERASGDVGVIARAIAAYVATRNSALAQKEDLSQQLAGQQPAWEVASHILSRAYGRGWPIARLELDPPLRRLLCSNRPAVIDGKMALRYWFAPEPETALCRKVSADERSFSHLDLCSFDPVFDLAGAAADCQTDELPRHLRRSWEELGGVPIDAERWLLYQLVHLWDAQRAYGEQDPKLTRASARVLQRYFGEIFFEDISPTQHGTLCALDIDGVLETEHLGFPALSPAGARALRALMVHGFRPVLVTGRSLEEVRDRCHAYHLSGGVAEYGAAIYNHQTGHIQDLLSTSQHTTLQRLRERLCALEGVHLDPAYLHSVRAYCYDGTGQRRALLAETIADVLAPSDVGACIRTIGGQSQTDFVIAEVDKGTGLLALAANLNPSGCAAEKRPIEIAVGDSSADLPMFVLASRAFAPAHASMLRHRPELTIMRSPYQAGLAQAVAQTLGHRPGTCPVCRTPCFAPRTTLLLTVLGAQEAGRRGMLQTALLAGLRGLRIA